MSSRWGSQKLLQGLVSCEITTYLSVSDLFLTQWIMAILSKASTPNKFESHNPLKLIFMNIQGLCSIFVECESFPDILALLKTLAFGDFNIHHKEWLTNSGGTDRLGAPCYNFSISNDLTSIVNFPNWIPDCDSHSSALLDLFLLLMLIFIIQWLSFH